MNLQITMIPKISQDSLFPYNFNEVLNQLSMSISSISLLYKDGYLSFDPAKKKELNAFEYYELDFVCSLINSCLSLESINYMLSKLDKPYSYEIDKVYYDFKAKEWKLIPIPEEPSIEELIDEIADEEDYKRLKEIKAKIDDAYDKFKNFKPDIGSFFKENFKDDIINYFYDVSIFDITYVNQNLYSFMFNYLYGDEEYAVSFDFNRDKLEYLIKTLRNRDLAKYLSSVLLKQFSKPEVVDFRDAPIKVGIKARLGHPVDSHYEQFIPFIIEEFI